MKGASRQAAYQRTCIPRLPKVDLTVGSALNESVVTQEDLEDQIMKDFEELLNELSTGHFHINLVNEKFNTQSRVVDRDEAVKDVKRSFVQQEQFMDHKNAIIRDQLK